MNKRELDRLIKRIEKLEKKVKEIDKLECPYEINVKEDLK